MEFDINKRITDCRLKAKLTKKDMAERLGLKYTTYCRMETKAKRINFEEVKRIAEVLGVDPEYLYNGPKNYNFRSTEPTILVAESPDRVVSPDEPKPPAVNHPQNEFICSSEEKALVTIFRSLTAEEKRIVRDCLDEIKTKNG